MMNGQPAAPPPPPPSVPKKRPTWLIVLVILAVIGCAIFACVAAVGFGLFKGAADQQKKVSQAEAHWVKATESLEKATALLDESDDKGATEAAKTADKEMRTLRDELAAAGAAIEQLDADTDGRREYVSSLDAAREAADGIQDMLAYIVTADQMSQGITRASSAANKANDSLDAAIEAANDEQWSRMESAARAASKSYSSAISGFKEAGKLDPRAGLDSAAAYCAARKKQADLVLKMAADGRAGRTSAYNKKIEQQRAMDKKAENTKEPAIISDDNWIEKRLGSLSDAISAAGERADELHAEALEKLGYSN